MSLHYTLNILVADFKRQVGAGVGCLFIIYILHCVSSIYFNIIHYIYILVAGFKRQVGGWGWLSLHYICLYYTLYIICIHSCFKRQVGEAGVGESEPCKALVDNGRETSPEIVSQNTFQKLSPHCWMGKKKV